MGLIDWDGLNTLRSRFLDSRSQRHVSGGAHR